MSQNRVVVWWDAEAGAEQWRVELQQQNSEGLYEAAQVSDDAGFPVKVTQFGPLDEDLLIQSIKSHFPEARISLRF
ncbi:MAG: hypothetical protein HGB15_00340 [Chlorobaculum sp.]|nr:hypothetical protein [Chlorobaculum sp.]